MRSSLEKSDPSNDVLLLALERTKKPVANIHTFLQACEDSFPASMRPTFRSQVKAEETFAIPELLEQILSHLSPREILDSMRVHSVFKRTVEESSELLKRLHLRANNKGHFSNTLLRNFPGLSAETHGAVHDQAIHS